jgi:hypothetical protein
MFRETSIFSARLSLILAATICVLACSSHSSAAEPKLPNFVIVFIDDMGYNDIQPFGAEGIETPHLNQMAADGMKFTDFQVSSAVCSASRAALITQESRSTEPSCRPKNTACIRTK